MKGLIFTYLLTYGGAAAALVNPFYGLLVYICFAIIKPENMWYFSVPAGNYSRIVAIGLLIGWALRGFGNRQFGRARGIVTALILYWIWMALCCARANNQAVAWEFFEGQCKIFLPFIVGMTIIDSVAQIKQVSWVIVLSMGYISLEMNQAYYGGFNRVKEIGFSGMDNNSAAIALVTAFGMAFFLGMDARGLWRKGIAFTCAALIGHTVLLTFSRGGMLGLAICGLISFILIPKQPRHYAVFALAILVAIRLTGEGVLERFGSAFDKHEGSDSGRLELWSALCKCMLSQPLGIGPAHWRLIAHEFGFTVGKDGHSTWLQMGAELGVVGLLVLLSFYWLCIARLWPLARGKEQPQDPWFAATARMIIAGLVGFMVSAQFVNLPGLELPYYAVLVGAAALKLSLNANPVPGLGRSPRPAFYAVP